MTSLREAEIDGALRDRFDRVFAERGGSRRDVELVLADVTQRLGRRSRRRTEARRVLAVAGVTAVALGVLSLWFWPTGDDRDRVRTQLPAGLPEVTPPSSDPGGPATTTVTTAPPQATESDTTSPTTAAPPASSPGSAARPGPENTGPTDIAALVPTTAAEIEAMMRPGVVIENVDITGGNIDVVADDVTIRNFRLDADRASFGFRSCGADADCGTSNDQKLGFVLEDGEIHNTTAAAFRGSHATLRQLEVHDSDTGAFVPITDVIIEESWWHHLGRGDDASGNAVRLPDGASQLTIRGNFCDLPVTVAAPYNSSACVIAGSDVNQVDSVSVERNWLNGGNHTVECNNQAGVAVHDNRFGRDHRHGPMSRCPNTSGNVWDDSGDPIS